MTAGRSQHSSSCDWGTPRKYVNAVYDVFGGPPALDPCGGPESVVAAITCYQPPVDGLAASWDYPTVYVNPPYGRDYQTGTTIKDWISRCAETHRGHASEIIALIPVAVNTRHWKDYIFGSAALICFLSDTRVKFRVNGSEQNKGCPMAIAAVYWGHRLDVFERVFRQHGALVRTI